MISQAKDLVTELARRQQTLAVCESLTGGELGAAITAIPGASKVFRGGFITYATSLKAELLGIEAHQIAQVGVVSEQTASWMAVKTRQLCHTDWALSTTGVAGPDWLEGHQPGTVYIGIDGLDPIETHLRAVGFHFCGDRASIRKQSVLAALQLALKVLRG